MEIRIREDSYSVYMHTVPNGKRYIGMTKQRPTKRWLAGQGYLRQERFYNAILQYGWKNIKHEVLYTGLTKEQAEEKEKELIARYKSNQREFGYNIESGGLSNSVCEETREKIRIANTGKHLSPETCEKLRLLEIERWKNEEYRRNQIEKRLGKPAWNKGKETPPETRAKQRDAKLGKYVGAKHWHSKPVINLDTGEIFESIGLAYKSLGVSNGTKIMLVCKGKRKTAYGSRWAYYEEVI